VVDATVDELQHKSVEIHNNFSHALDVLDILQRLPYSEACA